MAAGDRLNFRKQLRAVFDSNAAFHIRRLVAESLAEQIPQDNDWSLITHLHTQHRALFTPLYFQATPLEWHHFWLKFLVPHVLQHRDAHSLIAHVQRIALWKKSDPKDVIDFWINALHQDWVDRNQIIRTVAYELHDFDFQAGIGSVALIDMLLTFPHQDHDLLGHALARCIEAGCATDELLWRYIIGDIQQENIFDYQFGNKLRCDSHEFGNEDFLNRRMSQSESLLNLSSQID